MIRSLCIKTPVIALNEVVWLLSNRELNKKDLANKYFIDKMDLLLWLNFLDSVEYCTETQMHRQLFDIVQNIDDNDSYYQYWCTEAWRV